MPEQRLPGGFINSVIRVGDTVRRPAPARSEFVGKLLQFFGQRDWAGAPRFLGTDEQGRQVLGYIEGHVAWETHQPAAVRSEKSLIRAAQLVREFHDLTAGTGLAAGGEVVCHNDLSPRNTVYRDQGAGLCPVAFIDWDIAAPGRRIDDVAHVCWQYLGMGPGADVTETARLARVTCDGYQLVRRTELLDTILWWQDRCWRGIDSAARAGDTAMVRLRDGGSLRAVQQAYEWTLAHRADLSRAL